MATADNGLEEPQNEKAQGPNLRPIFPVSGSFRLIPYMSWRQGQFVDLRFNNLQTSYY